MSAVENIYPLQHQEQQAPFTAAKNIILMLQQAASVAQRNEERAKAQAAQWYEQYRLAQARISEIEGALNLAEDRAAEAEEWLERIHASIKESLLEPLLARSQRD